jgi:hypothetical protein
MGSNRRTQGIMVLAGAAAAGVLSGCGTSIVHSRPDAALIAPKVAAVVALPPKLGFGRAVEQRRAARRTGDALIEATGGHAILAEELGRTDPELIADEIRRLGEDPTQTLTFSVTAARGERVEAVGGVGGGARPVRRYMDYVVRLDVRRADQRDVIGSIETCATAFANGPEVDGEGKPVGLQKAINEAMANALKTFAPQLVPSAPFPKVVEVPQRADDSIGGGALAAIDKLRKLEALYPELSTDDLAALASSRARFLIVSPGRLASVGLARGDLVSGMGGQTLGSRGALARTLARGDVPAMTVDRIGGRFLVGQTLVARAR